MNSSVPTNCAMEEPSVYLKTHDARVLTDANSESPLEGAGIRLRSSRCGAERELVGTDAP